MKARLVVTVVLVHAIEHDAVEMNDEIEGMALALHKGHGATARLADTKAMSRTTTQRAEHRVLHSAVDAKCLPRITSWG
jgi:hypothetical protein